MSTLAYPSTDFPGPPSVAIEVPDMLPTAVMLARIAERMTTPGADTSTHAPWLENEANRSVASVAPTVMGCGRRAGEALQASAAHYVQNWRRYARDLKA